MTRLTNTPSSTFSHLCIGLAVSVLAIACDLPGTETSSGETSASDTSASETETQGPGDSSGGDASTGHDETCSDTESGESTGTGSPSDTPPEVAITMPAADQLGDDGAVYDDFDEDLQLWYVDVMLAADATDLEDGDLGGSVVWTTNQGTLQPPVLGSGAEITVRLYSDDCFGALHSLTATVTDSDGNTVTSAPRMLNTWTLC